MRVWLEQHVDGLSVECSTGSIVVQMASPSATFILEGVVRGHHIYIYKLDVGMFVDGRKYRRRLMVVLSTIDSIKLFAYLYMYAVAEEPFLS